MTPMAAIYREKNKKLCHRIYHVDTIHICEFYLVLYTTLWQKQNNITLKVFHHLHSGQSQFPVSTYIFFAHETVIFNSLKTTLNYCIKLNIRVTLNSFLQKEKKKFKPNVLPCKTTARLLSSYPQQQGSIVLESGPLYTDVRCGKSRVEKDPAIVQSGVRTHAVHNGR